MNYKLIFKKRLHTPGALMIWLKEQPVYRYKTIHLYLLKLIPAMERYQKRTGNGRQLEELKKAASWVLQQYSCYLTQKKPCNKHTVFYNSCTREYIVMCVNYDIHSFDMFKRDALQILKSERTLGMYNPDLWDGYACYFEAPELNEAVGDS